MFKQSINSLWFKHISFLITEIRPVNITYSERLGVEGLLLAWPYKKYKYIYLNFHALEVVSRYRDPQLQVGENHSYFYNLKRNKSDYIGVESLMLAWR